MIESTVRHKRVCYLLRGVVLTLLLCFAESHLAFGQWMAKQTGCYADSIVANPNRPTVSNPADITQYGVLELEYGWDQGSQAKSAGGLVTFGVLCDVELRWTTTSFQSVTDASGTHQSFGDNWLGPQIRVYRQTERVPTLSFSYSVKIPSAATIDGLGTGRVDHQFAFLASKDIKHFHFDFNASQFLIGRQNASGFDANQQLNLSVSHFIYRGLQFTGEFYGNTQLNQASPAFASTLWALTYTVAPRLVIDGGFESGITSGGPHLHAFVGATYSIANLYAALRRKR